MEFCNLKTWVNKDDVKVGDEGYFANDICILEKNIERDFKRKIKHIDQFRGNCFVADIDDNEPSCCSAYSGYTFFLPSEKARKPTYRPIANIDELLDFLVPDLDTNAVCDSSGNNDEIIRYKKAELLLGKKITVREKQGAYTHVMIIQSVDFYGDSDAGEDIHINNNPLNFMFEAYKILIDGEFVPFGVKA